MGDGFGLVLWGTGALSLILGFWSAIKSLRAAGYNVFSRRAVARSVVSLALGLMSFSVFAYVGSPADSALADTMKLMIVIGPLVGGSVFLSILIRLRRSVWEAHLRGDQYFSGVSVEEIEAWSARRPSRR